MRKIHESLTGTDPTAPSTGWTSLRSCCGCIAARSPRALNIARRSGLPFSIADLDAFVDEQRASAELIGVDRAAAPASVAELSAAYYEEMRPKLYACDEAKQALRLTISLRCPTATAC